MFWPVFRMVHIKKPLLLIGKSSPSGGSKFSLSCYLNDPLQYVGRYNRKYNVLSASLNETFKL